MSHISHHDKLVRIQKKPSFERSCMMTHILVDLPAHVDKMKNNTNIPIAIEFDQGKLISFAYGDILLRGYFLLTCTYGQYPQPNNESVADYADELQKWAIEKKLIPSSGEYVHKFKGSASRLALYLAPTFNLTETKIMTYLKFTGCFWLIDDIFDNAIDLKSRMIDTSMTIPELVSTLQSIVVDIFGGKFKSMGQIPKTKLPGFESLFDCMYEVYTLLIAQVPNYHDICSDYIKAMSDWIAHVSLFTDSVTANWNSDLSHMFLRRKSGIYNHIEIILLLNGSILPRAIRDSVLFQMFYECGCNIVCLSNDILSLRKELDCGEVSGNLVLRKTIKNGLNLNDSWNFVMDLCNAETEDFNKIAYNLIKKWPENKQLVEFIYLYRCFTDGSIKSYLDGERYGYCKYSTKQVVRTDELGGKRMSIV